MIRLIDGVVKTANDRFAIIMTEGGLGYLVFTTKQTKLPEGERIQLFTHLAVRENSLDLYGFITPTELDFFELLMTIPKIGPKSALQILDTASVSLISESVDQNDAGRLSKLSGLGKKTAEKIVQGLSGKIEAFSLTTEPTGSSHNPHYQDAFDTLITLGYNPANIRQVLDTLPEATNTSELVKQALRDIS